MVFPFQDLLRDNGMVTIKSHDVTDEAMNSTKRQETFCIVIAA